MVLEVENVTANAGDMRHRFSPQVGKIPWRRKRLPTPVFLPRKSQGQRSLEGYSPWGHKELDMTEHLYTHTQREKYSMKKKCLMRKI